MDLSCQPSFCFASIDFIKVIRRCLKLAVRFCRRTLFSPNERHRDPKIQAPNPPPPWMGPAERGESLRARRRHLQCLATANGYRCFVRLDDSISGINQDKTDQFGHEEDVDVSHPGKGST